MDCHSICLLYLLKGQSAAAAAAAAVQLSEDLNFQATPQSVMSWEVFHLYRVLCCHGKHLLSHTGEWGLFLSTVSR